MDSIFTWLDFHPALSMALGAGIAGSCAWYLFGDLFNDWKYSIGKQWRNKADLTYPINNVLPVATDAILAKAEAFDKLVGLLETQINANKTHAPVPQSLTYSPHTSQDRALEMSVTPGMNVTGGGAFKLFEAVQQDKRFAALPGEMSIPVEMEVNDNASVHAAD